MSNVTCFICKELVKKKEALSHLKEGQKVRKYFCSELHLQEHVFNLEQEQLKRLETDKFNEIDLIIAIEILQYELGQIAPPSLKKRIQKLRKNYPYEVIKLCIEFLKADLIKKMHNREFNDEQHKVNYIMWNIENNINDAYLIWKRRNEITKKQNLHSIDIDLMEEVNTSTSVTKQQENKGIMDFLEEDDF